MGTQSTSAITKPTLLLNRKKLDQLRRVNDIQTEKELASIIGIDTATLWRASNGYPVSVDTFTKVCLAFPHVPWNALFSIEQAKAVAV